MYKNAWVDKKGRHISRMFGVSVHWVSRLILALLWAQISFNTSTRKIFMLSWLGMFWETGRGLYMYYSLHVYATRGIWDTCTHDTHAYLELSFGSERLVVESVYRSFSRSHQRANKKRNKRVN